MAEIFDHLETLQLHGVSPVPQIGGFICHPCQSELSITTKQSFMSHAQNKHGLNAEPLRKLYHALVAVKTTFREEDYVKLYRGPSPVRSPLPKLPDLQVEDTRRCPLCPAISKSLKCLTSHLKATHSLQTGFAKRWREAQSVSAQSLSKKKGDEFFFPVFMGHDIEDQESSVDHLAIRDLLRNYDPSSVLVMKEAPEDQREHSQFMFIAKPQERSKKYKLELKDAITLVAGPSELPEEISLSAFSEIRASLQKYYDEARALGKLASCFQVHISTLPRLGQLKKPSTSLYWRDI